MVLPLTQTSKYYQHFIFIERVVHLNIKSYISYTKGEGKDEIHPSKN